MKFSYSRSDIQAFFSSGPVRRGNDCYLNGRIVTQTNDADTLYGLVRGSQNQQYDVRVKLSSKGGGVFFDANCTCPVGQNCKHAIALLLANLTNTHPSAGPQKSIPASGKGKIESWLGKLNDQLNPKLKDVQAEGILSSKNRLLYILTVNQYGYGEKLTVNYLSARLLKAGGYGASSRYDPYRIVTQGRSAFVDQQDEVILREACSRKMLDHIDTDLLSAAGGIALLEKMLHTERCFWKTEKSQPLSLGKPIPGKLVWRAFENGDQQLTIVAENDELLIFPTSPPYYFNEATQQCGLLQLDLPDDACQLIQNSPKVPASELPSISERFVQVSQKLPKPVALKVKQKHGVKPVPYMHFFMQQDEALDPYDYYDPIPAMKVQVDYDGQKISLFDTRDEVSYRKDKQLIQIKRDRKAEAKIQAQLTKKDIVHLQDFEEDESYPVDVFTLIFSPLTSENDAWITFMLEELPLLKGEGWRVSLADDFPYNVAHVDEWHMSVDEESNNQWFDLSLGIMVDGKEYNLISIISAVMRQNANIFKNILSKERNVPENLLVRLANNQLLALPIARIERIVQVLTELFDKKGDVGEKVSLPKWRAGELSELQSQGLLWQGDKALKDSAKRLSQFKKIKPKAAPKAFKAELRPYQKDGLAWLQFLREYEFHGILADDMGLGKTVQALAHICVEKSAKRLKKPVLVVAPTSLMYNWRHETEQFAPHLTILTLHGPDRKKDFDRIAEHDIVLTTYPLLGRDDKVLLAQDWHMVILDEAQNIKNPKTKATKVVCQLQANHRLCLTGTPMENHLGELWSIFNFLMPGLLGNERQFRQIFRTPIEKQGNTDRAERLAKRIAPFMLRRTKSEVVKELPPKTEIVRSVPLEGVQRDLYETVRISMQKKVRDSINQLGLNRSHIIVLDALLKLRQICCDPRLLKTEAKAKRANSVKFELLMTLLPELLEEGRKILLFSQFTSMLSLIEAELKTQKINYVKLTGSTRNREKPITEFQNGDVPLFLISLKAGGTGLNLTAADTVIHYDPWWNPAAEAQATDRAHRIGQDKPVFVYKLLTEGTVEARIQIMQESKRQLAAGLFNTSSKGRLPNAEDMQTLFEPLEGELV